MTVFFLVCFSLPSVPLLRRVFRSSQGSPESSSQESGAGTASTGTDSGGATLAAEYWKPRPISLLDIAQALAIAVVIAGVSHLFAGWIAGLPAPAGSRVAAVLKGLLGQPYLVLTTLCVLVASVLSRWLDRIGGAEELGTYLIYLFFFVIGAPASVRDIFQKVPLLFVLCAIMATTNLLVTFALTFLCRRTIEEAALAVNATLGGAPSAAAMAIAKGWRPLVLPSILVGTWGYVVGTYLGFMIDRILARLI